MNHHNPFLALLSLITLAISATTPDNFGPQTGVSWTLSSGQFTALQFTVLIPPTLPWTHQFFFLIFEPGLQNIANPTWNYVNEITYQNLSGPPVVPPYYNLVFVPQVAVGGPPETTANVAIHPSDTITVSFLKTGATWNQQWSVVRGSIGKAAGASASSGTYSHTFPAAETFDLASLGVYFGSTFWDFGPVTWSNIKLTASTTDASWCTPTPTSIYATGVNATYPNGLSVATISGASSTCALQTMIWAEPPGALAAEAAYQVKVARCDKIIAEGGVCTY